MAEPYDRHIRTDHHHSQLHPHPIFTAPPRHITAAPTNPPPIRSCTPVPSRTPQQQLSRPLEDCEGRPALAGVRNLRLDDPSADCSDLHRNFGVRSIWARRAAAARRAGSLERGCTGRTVRRAEWQALAECVARGGDHAATGARSWQASQASGAAALAGRRARTRTRRAGSHPPRSPLQPALEQRPDPGLTARGLEGGVAHFGSKKRPQRPPRLCEALQNH